MQSKPVKRYSRALFTAVCLLVLTIAAPSVGFAASDKEFRELQRTVQELKRQLDKAEQKIEEMSREVSGNAQAVEAAAMAIEEADSKPSVFDNMSIGGYGELHYNNLDADVSANDKEEIDFHRFVLHFNYDWSDNLRVISELEVEHALVGADEEEAPGEVELEQAYIEYDFDARNTARAGVFLLPIGILNETHEPPTFYGVERNVVESVIIPVGWWAGGVGFSHRADNGVSLDLALHEGLKVTPGAEASIRGGRQKTAEASADDLAFTGRLKYTGMPGLELGASIQYQSDLAQDEPPEFEVDDDGDVIRDADGNANELNDIKDAWLYEAHVAFNRGPFGLRALYAQWDLDADGAVEEYDDQKGWFVEPSFRLGESLGVFARYADVEGGRSRDEFDQWTLGFNYWLNEDVVLKADWQDRDHDNDGDEGRDFDGFNLGVGYQF